LAFLLFKFSFFFFSVLDREHRKRGGWATWVAVVGVLKAAQWIRDRRQMRAGGVVMARAWDASGEDGYGIWD
jgi:hypothetical protein